MSKREKEPKIQRKRVLSERLLKGALKIKKIGCVPFWVANLTSQEFSVR